ncbi:NADH dehydrogenase [ubiquinone] iron-sulfur protein 5-A isoform C [Neolecta irregularis DAH-3]|uniref:NADH dehydrogenase [ubiquinone] iron-sulfur protein 5 n=1 Tax=Neolecta irregularis (strain DAH-3) TaxID=1198029 RepID=A0A1U7LIF9_NEOID|nr:NADH dehydrogenase [ubiquinone] iron-sulfur protein 5-A isoform A [Neolecta irregularis DAH-3]OLL22436.1 NADH dehydrogenase [ubiquinone] iron-sulfur protein 5-A isoform B [Neolecta irregularis DAH-3]OLL22437.1 NADH dehydrogenase [ubiquinone] iron-sulfur protein 5-A isoform C [Neolecta irregularis DAH-3]|eukprot:OLL22435.1 NADH dehydrogenase [ubiquinone] iron-sulfur protein 5-A isoform A [Neolecta irregularis DAH-3]
MSSGFGIHNASPPRCHRFFQEFTACFASRDNPRDCQPFHQDYFECLHGRKAKGRHLRVVEETLRSQKSTRDRIQNALDGHSGLGLIDRPE